MKFFEEFYPDFYNGKDIPYGSELEKHLEEKYKAIDKKYIEYLEANKKHFPKNFLETYFKYDRFEEWDITEIKVDNCKLNIPDRTNITMVLEYRTLKERIIIEFKDVCEFSINFSSEFLKNLKDFFGNTGINEFGVIDGKISHEIYFYKNNEYIKIISKSIDVRIENDSVEYARDNSKKYRLKYNLYWNISRIKSLFKS